MTRIALNGDKKAAEEYVNRLAATARGEKPEEQRRIIVSSMAEFAQVLRGKG